MADVKSNKSTPFNLLLSLYATTQQRTTLATIHHWDTCNQIQYLKSETINTKTKRDQLKHTFQAQIRILLKSIISKYYKESQLLTATQNISSWTEHQIIISLISYAIENHNNISLNPTIWTFIEYLRQYINDNKYNGAKFHTLMTDNTNIQCTQLVTDICSKYELNSSTFVNLIKEWIHNIRSYSSTAICAQIKSFHLQTLDSNNIPTNILSLLFTLYCTSKPLNIEGIDALNINEQLNILNIETIYQKKWKI
eukprot:539896_1